MSVEFALILLPYFMTFGGIFEVGLYITKASVLQNAVELSARMVRTGQLTSLTQFKDVMTQNTFGLIDVNSLSVNATSYNSFGAIPNTLPSIFDNGGNPTNQNFQTGIGNQVVVLRAGSRYNFITPIVSSLIDVSGAGIWTFTSTEVFRNEAF